MQITAFTLNRICPKNKGKNFKEVADAINKVCPLYGINTPDIMHEFLANILEETGEFTEFEEDLRYSVARLMIVWPKRFPTVESAKNYEYAPKLLAEKVYGMRKDLGNTQPGDGWRFRGSGAIQITGRANVTTFCQYMKKVHGIDKDPITMAELIRTDLEIGMHASCWIFAIAFKLIDEAERDEMKAIVKKINGGYTNISTRMKYYELCKKYIA